MIPVAFRTVALWCAQCAGYVELEGPVFVRRIDAPVHITPQEWAAHRAAAHGAVRVG